MQRTVFIINEQESSHYDLEPAKAFGEIVFVNPVDRPVPVRARDEAINRAHEVLANATKDDYLIWAGGDPLGLVIASAIMADKTNGQFNYLKWDRRARNYTPTPLTLFNGDEE